MAAAHRSGLEESFLEEQFVLFTHQYGPITTVVRLLELLSVRCGDQLTSRAELLEHPIIWTDNSPLTLPLFRRLMSAVRARQRSSGQHFASCDDCHKLFTALSDGADFAPTRLVQAVCTTLQSTAFDRFPLECISLATFTDTVMDDAELSRRIATKLPHILRAAAAVLAEADPASAALPADEALASSPVEDAGGASTWERLTAVHFAAPLRVVQEEMAQEALERETQRRNRERARCLGGRRRAYFAPVDVVNTSGSTVGEGVRSIAVAGPSPLAALSLFGDAVTAQTMAARAAELRKRRRAEAQQRVMLERDAVLVATRRLPEEELRRLEGVDLSGVSVGGHFDETGSRLHPHTLSPSNSISRVLFEKLGVEYTPIATQPAAARTGPSRAASGPRKAFIPRRLPPPVRDPGRAAAEFFRSTAPRSVTPNFDTQMPPRQSVRTASHNRSRPRSTTSASSAHLSPADALHEVTMLLATVRADRSSASVE